MKKITTLYRVLFCCIVTINVQLYAQLGEPCSLNVLKGALTSEDITNPVFIAYCPDGRCFAVVNQTAHTVSVFKVDPETDTVILVGAYPTRGLNPFAAAYSPNGRCLVVTNTGGNETNSVGISVFSVDPDTCALSLVTDQPISTEGPNPTAVAFSPLLTPNGAYCFAVVNNTSGTVSAFTLNPTTCQVTLINSCATGSSPFAVHYSPNGTCLVVTNFNAGYGAGTLSIFAVDQITGALEPMGSADSNGIMPSSVTYLCDGQYLAVVNSNLVNDPNSSPNISIFSVDPNYKLTLIPEKTIELPAESGSFAGAYFPDGNCFAVAHLFANTVTKYKVDSACQLTQVGEPIRVGSFPRSLAYCFNDQCLVVANSGFNPLVGPGTDQGSISLLSATLSTVTIRQILSTCLSPASVFGTSAQPGATVRLYVDDILIAASTADSEGNFFMANLPVQVGTHCFVAEDVSTGYTSLPVRADIKIVPTSHLFTPNMSFGTHYSRLR